MEGNLLFKINDFFEEYAGAIESFYAKSMVHCYDLPCSFISDEKSSVFADAAQLEGFFSQGASFYKQQGIVYARPEVWNKILWKENIVKVKLIWHYCDANNQPVYSCDYQYVLLWKDGRWKISVAVSLNEKQRMEEWLQRKA